MEGFNGKVAADLGSLPRVATAPRMTYPSSYVPMNAPVLDFFSAACTPVVGANGVRAPVLHSSTGVPPLHMASLAPDTDKHAKSERIKDASRRYRARKKAAEKEMKDENKKLVEELEGVMAEKAELSVRLVQQAEELNNLSRENENIRSQLSQLHGKASEGRTEIVERVRGLLASGVPVDVQEKEAKDVELTDALRALTRHLGFTWIARLSDQFPSRSRAGPSFHMAKLVKASGPPELRQLRVFMRGMYKHLPGLSGFPEDVKSTLSALFEKGMESVEKITLNRESLRTDVDSFYAAFAASRKSGGDFNFLVSLGSAVEALRRSYHREGDVFRGILVRGKSQLTLRMRGTLLLAMAEDTDIVLDGDDVDGDESMSEDASGAEPLAKRVP